jgi:hypothetical protein
MSGRRMGSRYVLERKVADSQLQRRVALELMASERIASPSARHSARELAAAFAALLDAHRPARASKILAIDAGRARGLERRLVPDQGVQGTCSSS